VLFDVILISKLKLQAQRRERVSSAKQVTEKEFKRVRE
jgi:hypothetical protein